MKVVNREAFLKMPRGTVFCKLQACVVGELQIKMDTTASGNDFVYRDMIELDSNSSNENCDMLIEACEQKVRDTLPLDWHRDMSRDGLFDHDQMYGVLDREEVTSLIDMLTEARDMPVAEQHEPCALSLQVGKVYKDREGQHVVITHESGGADIFTGFSLIDHEIRYFNGSGSFTDKTDIHVYDLVKEVRL